MPLDTTPDPGLPDPPDGAKPVPDPCPNCGRAHCLHIADRMATRPPGEAAIAGAQPKRLARPGPVLQCRSCDASAPLHVEPGGTHARLPDPDAMRPPRADAR
jgi:hypothetical protein